MNIISYRCVSNRNYFLWHFLCHICDVYTIKNCYILHIYQVCLSLLRLFKFGGRYKYLTTQTSVSVEFQCWTCRNPRSKNRRSFHHFEIFIKHPLTFCFVVFLNPIYQITYEHWYYMGHYMTVEDSALAHSRLQIRYNINEMFLNKWMFFVPLNSSYLQKLIFANICMWHFID